MAHYCVILIRFLRGFENMNKHFIRKISLIIVALLVILGNTINIAASDDDDNWYCTVSGIIDGYSGSRKDIIIPTKYKGRYGDEYYYISGAGGFRGAVTRYNFETSQPKEYYTSLTIPDELGGAREEPFMIGRFEGFSGFTKVSFPDNSEFSEEGTFSGCSSLVSINLPSGNGSNTYLVDKALYGCSSLKSVTIPESYTAIGKEAFYGCDSLTDVYFGGSEKDWEEMGVNEGNEALQSADVHFGKYSVLFESNGGSEVEYQSVAEGGTADVPSEPEKEGYFFRGWFVDEGLLEKYDFDTPVSSNTVLYAKWVEKCTVTFIKSNDEDNEEECVGYGEKVEPLSVSWRSWEGFRCVGWYTDAELTKKYDFDKAVTGDIILYAKWDNRRTVSFDTVGGSEIESQIVEYGGKATRPPENPTKEGYIFYGWYLYLDSDYEYDFEKEVWDDITIYAVWDRDLTPKGNQAEGDDGDSRDLTPSENRPGTGGDDNGDIAPSENRVEGDSDSSKDLTPSENQPGQGNGDSKDLTPSENRAEGNDDGGKDLTPSENQPGTENDGYRDLTPSENRTEEGNDDSKDLTPSENQPGTKDNDGKDLTPSDNKSGTYDSDDGEKESGDSKTPGASRTTSENRGDSGYDDKSGSSDTMIGVKSIKFMEEEYVVDTGSAVKLNVVNDGGASISANYLSFEISDSAVAQVSGDGVLSGLASGRVTVTAKLNGTDLADSCIVLVSMGREEIEDDGTKYEVCYTKTVSQNSKKHFEKGRGSDSKKKAYDVEVVVLKNGEKLPQSAYKTSFKKNKKAGTGKFKVTLKKKATGASKNAVKMIKKKWYNFEIK